MILLQKALWFIVALGVLIVVHEYGHYLAARLCRVKVLRFSVGFGRPMLSWRRGADRTEWVIAAIPLGGYVKMADEREGPVEPEDLGRAFNRQSVWKRLFIVAAGPVFNFMFAVVVYTGLFMYGLPEAKPVLAEPPPGTAAQIAGFRAGDTVRSINGEALATWSDLRWRLVKGALEQESVQIEVANDKQQLSTHRLDLSSLSASDVESDVLGRLGLVILPPTFESVLGEIINPSPAHAAGLLPGDRIIRVQDSAIRTWQEFVRIVQQNPGKPLTMVVERGERTFAIELTPERVEQNGRVIGRIGAAPREADRFFVRVSYGPFESLVKASAKTCEISLFTLRMLGKMLIGQISWKHISGPITIADFAGQSAQMGWISFVTFLALISISLGVLNLLPIPLLDGGHLMYYAIELVKGRPVSERAMELGQRVGLALLLVMMAFAFYNDFNRLLSS